MAYEKTVWNNDGIPAIDADNLNKIEQGIADSIRRDGDTMKAPLKLCGEYENDNDAVDKGYVDSLVKIGTFVIPDKNTSFKVDLDFTPSAVIVACDHFGNTRDSYDPNIYQFAIAAQNSPQISPYHNYKVILEIGNKSFTYYGSPNYGRNFRYFAFR